VTQAALRRVGYVRVSTASGEQLALADPDLAEAIELKRARLKTLSQVPQIPPKILQALRDPEMYEQATYEELTELYHRFVEQVVVTKQAVERVVLRF